MRVTVSGSKRARTALIRLERDLSDLSEPTRAAGRDLQAAARRRAPVRTGRLRGSIGLTVIGNTAIISTGARYGGYVEYGTRVMRAQPYMRPATLVDVTPHYEQHAATACAKF